MTGVVSFENIHDMRSVAKDFSGSLSDPSNADIARDFPGTVDRYTGTLEAVHEQLMTTREQCKNGTREQFVIFAGSIAVGLSAIQLVDKPPKGIDATIPNLSGMIFNPWRGKGFGSLSLKYRLDIANDRFHGKAYSLVRKDNIISQKLVESNGLFVVDENDERFTYLYDANNS